MSSSYHPGLSLDRVDNSRGYSKENCRWSTRRQQQNNTRRNIRLDGQFSMAEAARKAGIPYDTFRARIKKLHWSLDKSVLEPVHPYEKLS